jgi:hypothetical protein
MVHTYTGLPCQATESEREVRCMSMTDAGREGAPVLNTTAACVSIRQHTSAYVSIRQHTSAYVSWPGGCSRAQHNCSIRQHTSAYVSIRQHTSAYVSIRHYGSHRCLRCRDGSSIQHTSAYVSIRQHTALREVFAAQRRKQYPAV